MSTRLRICLALAVCLILAGGLAAERPRVYALKGAKIVTAPGKVIDNGTIVVRDGLIEAVGASVTIPPDAVEIDAKGKTIYPGLIDALTNVGFRRAQAAAQPQQAGRGGGRQQQQQPPGQSPIAALIAQQAQQQTQAGPPGISHELSRLRPEIQAASLLVPFEGESPESERYRALGFTTLVAAPEGNNVIRGESALINLRDNVSPREIVLRTGTAQHIAIGGGGFGGGGGGGGGYPGSLMGTAAAIRQAFLDTQRYVTWKQRYEANPTGMKRPETSAALEALAPALARQRRVVFETGSPADILLADRLAREFNLDAVVVGTGTEWEVLDQVKKTGRPVILSAAFPERPRVDTPEDAVDAETQALRRYLNAPANAKKLNDAGVKFALSTRGVRNLPDFKANVKKMIDAGLPLDTALAALTTTPAELLGVSRQLGTLDAGKIANLIVADGDLFAERTRITSVFVDGYEYRPETTAPAAAPGTTRGQPSGSANPTGTWSVSMDMGGRSMSGTWTIRRQGQDFAGSAEMMGRTTELSSVKLEGNRLTVTLPSPQGEREITVTIQGDSFEGTAQMGPASVTLKGTRTSGPTGGEL
jgi:imidazolonepropionase-like amidohydrolase